MSYSDYETSVEDGRPFYLYQFASGAEVWRFAALEQVREANGETWDPRQIGHGSVVQSGDPRRVDLSVSMPISDPWARRFLGAPGDPMTITIFRGHHHDPSGDVVAWWKGRVISARTEGERILLRCESLFTSMKRQGVRAKYQRTCRHALYHGGCRLALADWQAAGTVSAIGGRGVGLTVAEAAEAEDGRFSGGILQFGDVMGMIARHAGATVRLFARMPALEAEVAANGSASVLLAPGCDLTRATCDRKFGNVLNFGGFPLIPGRNPFDGSSIV